MKIKVKVEKEVSFDGFFFAVGEHLLERSARMTKKLLKYAGVSEVDESKKKKTEPEKPVKKRRPRKKKTE